MAAVAVSAVVANAAATSWKMAAANVYGADGANKYSGSIYLFCSELTSASSVSTALSGKDSASAVTAYLAGAALHTASASAGTVSNSLAANQFATEELVVGNTYSFYYVFVDSDSYFISAEKTGVIAQATSTVNIAFGNQQSATQAAGNWTAVPEPTSGLLLILGMASLALKRKRA